MAQEAGCAGGAKWLRKLAVRVVPNGSENCCAGGAKWFRKMALSVVPNEDEFSSFVLFPS
jgi:hypothetical protein